MQLHELHILPLYPMNIELYLFGHIVQSLMHSMFDFFVLLVENMLSY
jgi:hypothetical protein